jgi:hypothetical protein
MAPPQMTPTKRFLKVKKAKHKSLKPGKDGNWDYDKILAALKAEVAEVQTVLCSALQDRTFPFK